jgi:hypothetical protein
MTRRGARLTMDNTWVVPPHFVFMDMTRPEVRRPATIVWRNQDALGIRFEDAA